MITWEEQRSSMESGSEACQRLRESSGGATTRHTGNNCLLRRRCFRPDFKRCSRSSQDNQTLPNTPRPPRWPTRHPGFPLLLTVLVVIATLLLSSGTAVAYNCSCDRAECRDRVENCTNGIVVDQCGCCLVCGKGANATCGGLHGLLGRCGPGLFCEIQPEQGLAITGAEVGRCRPMEVCKTVKCEHGLVHNNTCPRDSILLPPVLTQDGCCQRLQGCSCATDVTCPPKLCPGELRVQVTRPATGHPGACCDVFECVNETQLVCHHNGSEYREGDSWQLDLCTSCQCKSGLKFCSRAECHTPKNCRWLSVPPGQCCPVCKGCLSARGDLYGNDETWMDDPCVTCRCVDGEKLCDAQMCHARCANPVRVEGQCCPVCDEEGEEKLLVPGECPRLDNCSLLCDYGLQRDDRGCYECQCVHLNKGTKKVTAQTTTLPTRFDHTPCPALVHCKKSCIYGFKIRKSTGCPRCSCNKCPRMHCKKKCLQGYMVDHNGCKLCQCAEFGGAGGVTRRPHLQDRHVCMTTDGRHKHDGESWHDGCRRCYCHASHEMCALITCPVPRCRHPMIHVGDCCPSCGEGTAPMPSSQPARCRTRDGMHYHEGDTWHLDPCTRCLCHDGGVLCEIESCPPVLCHHPVRLPNRCCPVCPDSDALLPFPPYMPSMRHCKAASGTVFAHGDTWRVSTCQSCLCDNGQINCFSQTCPLLTCKKTVMRKGQCCPYCTASERQACRYDGHRYAPGESWLVGSCTKCICMSAQPLCTEVNCPSLRDCASPLYVKGVCCPVCTNHSAIFVTGADFGLHHKDTIVATHLHPYRTAVGVLITVVVTLVILALVLFLLLRRSRRRRSYDLPAAHAPGCQVTKACNTCKSMNLTIDLMTGNRCSQVSQQAPVVTSNVSEVKVRDVKVRDINPHHDLLPEIEKPLVNITHKPCEHDMAANDFDTFEKEKDYSFCDRKDKDYDTFCSKDSYHSDSLSKKPLVENSGSDTDEKMSTYEVKDKEFTDSDVTYRDNDAAYSYDDCDVTSEDLENKCNEVLLMQEKTLNRYSIGDPLSGTNLDLPEIDPNSYRKSV